MLHATTTSSRTPPVSSAGCARGCGAGWHTRGRRSAGRRAGGTVAPGAAAQPCGGIGGARRRAGTRRQRARRFRLHARCLQVARLRVCLRQSRLELPRPARIGHQLRRQQESRADYLLPRRVVGGDGARLLQGRGQADCRDGARDGGTAARVDGDLQRVVRSSSGLRHSRQPRRCRDSPRRRVVPPASRTRRRWFATTPSGTISPGR